MTDYIMLYRSHIDAYGASTPEEMRQSMVEWTAWEDKMTERGQLQDFGMPLEREGSVVRGKSRVILDGPYAETKEIVAGFSIIRAKGLAEATTIASGCPILQSGGSVEVRPVVDLERLTADCLPPERPIQS